MIERTLADSIDDLTTAVLKCKRDRDELLAACKLAFQQIDAECQHYGDETTSQVGPSMGQLRDRIGMVIKRVNSPIVTTP